LGAVQSGMKDFEDALQLAAALASGAEVLITRNTSDFKASPFDVAQPIIGVTDSILSPSGC
jgi:hypothetical protein